MRDDPFAVVGEAYRHLGRELTPAVEQAMRDWSEGDLYGSFGSYSYTLEQYGLTCKIIDDAFAEYRQRFAN